MQFNRSLSPYFIDTLNDLYEADAAWWRKIADDENNFILIRNNSLRVQANGGLLMQINQNGQKDVICKMHEDFLTLRSEKNPYVTLGEKSSSPIGRVEGLQGFARNYAKIKRRISIFIGREKQAVQYLANNIKQVVDVEIGFEGDLKEDAKRKSVPRIDMALINDDGTLVFYEVKLFDNGEIHSQQTQRVVNQLRKYRELLAKYRKEIIDGYTQQLNTYQKLKGRFFQNRSRDIEKISLYPDARLIITGFDASQRDIMLPIVRKKIEKGTGWGNGSNDLIATGNHKALAKSNRMFLGL